MPFYQTRNLRYHCGISERLHRNIRIWKYTPTHANIPGTLGNIFPLFRIFRVENWDHGKEEREGRNGNGVEVPGCNDPPGSPPLASFPFSLQYNLPNGSHIT